MKNYLARYPKKRKYLPRPEEITTLVTIPLPPLPTNSITPPGPGILRHPTSSGIGRGAGAVLPTWMTHSNRNNGPTPPPADDSSKCVCLCVE
jgi:hypothetical protein